MEKEVKKYLIEQCRAWMLPEELKALKRSTLTKDGESSIKKIALEEIKMEILYGFKDDKTNELASLNTIELENKIALRLLQDHEDELINKCPKCPKCYKLARTPYAKQCRYCQYDWH